MRCYLEENKSIDEEVWDVEFGSWKRELKFRLEIGVLYRGLELEEWEWEEWESEENVVFMFFFCYLNGKLFFFL